MQSLCSSLSVAGLKIGYIDFLKIFAGHNYRFHVIFLLSALLKSILDILDILYVYTRRVVVAAAGLPYSYCNNLLKKIAAHG